MSIIQDPTRFLSSLKKEKNSLYAFVEILKKEENSLVHGNFEDIDYLSSDKLRLIEELVSFDTQRNQYLISQGCTPDGPGMTTWIEERQSLKLEAQVLWEELLKVARIAQQLNHTNGIIISTHLQHNQRAFTALQSAAGNISLYGPNGQAFI